MSEKTGPIRVGIVGLGRSGWNIHARAYRSMPEMFKLVAVTDLWAERAAECARKDNVRHLPTFDAILADPDVEMVVVASYNRFHAEQATAALRAGKHVLCEKPFGLPTADADMMIDASQVAGRVLQPFQQRRYEHDFRKVKEICGSGRLGQLQFIRICWHGFRRRWDWQTTRSTGGGTLNNNGPHLIDHAMELFGEGEPTVWCEMRRGLCSGEAEDHLKIILTGQGKPTIDIELSDLFAFGQDRWLVCGTAGGLRGDGNKLEWKWVDWSAMPPRPLDLQSTPDRSYNRENLNWQTATWTPQTRADTGGGGVPADQPVIDLYNDLYKTIRHGAPQVITPQSVRRRVAVMEKARQFAGQRALAEPRP
jgi:scyllo-inositol 2-dehydrogenase (NADP+)